ncbi:MAG: DUF4236 domain-containing protein [Nitrospirae bacterium]|nr:DUF4236 domain-containing protein [Nitrospirota bacterium]
MGFRFFQSVGIGKHLRVNLGKSLLPSLTGHAKGISLNVGKSGLRVIGTIPGMGIGYSVTTKGLTRTFKKVGKQLARDWADLGKGGVSAAKWLVEKAAQQSQVPAATTLQTPKASVVDPQTSVFQTALELFSKKEFGLSLGKLSTLQDHPDALFLAGLIQYHSGKYDAAKKSLDRALSGADHGSLFSKVGAGIAVEIPLTPEIGAEVAPTTAGLKLMLVEVLQASGEFEGALGLLRALQQELPESPVVKLSLAELLAIGSQHKEVVNVLEGVQNNGPVETACLLYRGRALKALRLNDAAYQTFAPALYRTKDRPPSLLRDIRYEKAVCAEELGKKAEAKKEFERIYAEDPRFKDVKARLDLA